MYPQVTQLETHTRLVQEHLEQRRIRDAARRQKPATSWWRRLFHDRVSPGGSTPRDEPALDPPVGPVVARPVEEASR